MKISGRCSLNHVIKVNRNSVTKRLPVLLIRCNEIHVHVYARAHIHTDIHSVIFQTNTFSTDLIMKNHKKRAMIQ